MKQPKMRKGAVMMEYVILAVMIAAAALVAIIYFGKTITSQAETAAYATAGQAKNAQENVENNVKKNASAAKDKGEEHNSKFHDQGETKDGGKGGEGGGNE